MIAYLKEILVVLGQDKKRLPRLLLLFFFVSLLDIAGIGLIGPYVSIIMDPEIAVNLIARYASWIYLPLEVKQLIIYMSLVLLCIFIFKTISAIWIHYKIIQFSVNHKIRLSILLMDNYQNLPYTDYLSRNSSEYIHTTQNLVDEFSGSIIVTGMKMVSDGIVAMVIMIMLAITNFNALLILSSLLLVSLMIYDRIFRKKMKTYGKLANISAMRMVKGIHEGMEGLKEVRVLGHEKYFLNKVKSGATEHGQYSMYRSIVGTIPRYLIELIMILFVVLIVIITISTNNNVSELVPVIAMFGIAAIRLIPAANGIIKGVMAFRFQRDSVSRLYNDVIGIYPKKIKQEIVHNEPLPSFKNLTMKNVSFRYPGANQDALSNINLEIFSGDSIGIIGQSGSGKTTLIDTLLGLLTPKDGDIFINDKRVESGAHELRNHVAYLPQQVFIIDASLKENIALGLNEEEIDLNWLIQSVEKASLSELVAQLPQGVDTILGERGVRLSGGQRQRIAIARAFYHERDVMIMDESTSSLDTETEKEIVEEIKKLKGDKTMIVIAHRISTVKDCDKIYRLDKGKIIDYGLPNKILN